MNSERQQRLNEATILLLSRVTGVDGTLLATVELRPRTRNWIRAPWFGEDPGGAMVLGRRIYLSNTFYHAPRSADLLIQLQWLLLMAHEVVHVHQGRHFGTGPLGRSGFALWAAGQYTHSFLLHGTNAYQQAHFEQEAEAGRIALRQLL